MPAKKLFNTSIALSAGSSDNAGETKRDGFSAQNAGISTTDFVSSTNGGAVMFDRSPVMVAIEARKSLSEDLFADMAFWPLSPFSVAEKVGLKRKRRVWKTILAEVLAPDNLGCRLNSLGSPLGSSLTAF